MSCCRCIKRLEHVEKVIEEYDPNETFVNYKLLTLWVNKKTKKAYVLVSKENGIATWVPINADITTIDKIILNCGEVEANENNEIIHTGECGARTVTDDCTDLCITIETEWGLKGGGIVCAGEKLTLGIDLANTNLVISNVTDVQDGDLVAFDGTSGKVIKKADNLKLGDADNSWNGKINPTTKALEFFPNDLSSTPIFSMLPNGVITSGFQPKFSAKLAKTPTFDRNAYFRIGSNLAFEKIRDEDGYNKSANNFFVGGGGNYAYYKCPYSGLYGIVYQFVIDQGRQKSGTRMVSRINFGPENNFRQLKKEEKFADTSFQTISGTTFLPLNKDDRIFIDILIESDAGDPFISSAAVLNEIDNYFGCYLAVG